MRKRRVGAKGSGVVATSCGPLWDRDPNKALGTMAWPSRWHGGTEPPSADQQHDAFASSAAGRPASPAQGITDMAASPSGSTCAVPSEITSEIGASDSHTPLENMGPGRPKSHKKVVNPSPEKSKVVDTSSELAEKTGEEEDL
ncbi:hypothetical protein THAOC_00878, partial [Thalassiosira oceanica]